MGDLNKWIEENYKELITICDKVARMNDQDLCQMCIEQFISNKKTISIPDNQKLFFFTRIVQNNFNSSSSRYYKFYKKHKFQEIENIEIKEEEYEEDPDRKSTRLNSSH